MVEFIRTYPERLQRKTIAYHDKRSYLSPGLFSYKLSFHINVGRDVSWKYVFVRELIFFSNGRLLEKAGMEYVIV